MKILYYTHICFLDCDLPLIKAFQEEGHEVYFLVELTNNDLKSTLVEIDCLKNDVDIVAMSTYSEFDKFSDYIDKDKSYILNKDCKTLSFANIKLRLKFLNFIKEINPDVIHCTCFIDTSDLFLYKFRQKIVQIVHDPFPHSGENSFRRSLKRKVAYKLIKKFVLLNQKQSDCFLQQNKLHSCNVFFNKLGTYDCIKLFDSKTVLDDLPNNLILFWGRISPYKGIEYLLNAMDLVHEAYPDLKLVVAGAGEYYFDITKYQQKDYVKIINRHISMDEMRLLLSKALITVCPYIDATQSGVVMTSYTMNVPVIVTNVGGLPEMVDEGQSGYIVPPKDSEAIAHKIMSIASNSDLRMQLEEYIKTKNNSGTNNWIGIAKQYIKIYKTKVTK